MLICQYYTEKRVYSYKQTDSEDEMLQHLSARVTPVATLSIITRARISREKNSINCSQSDKSTSGRAGEQAGGQADGRATLPVNAADLCALTRLKDVRNEHDSVEACCEQLLEFDHHDDTWTRYCRRIT